MIDQLEQHAVYVGFIAAVVVVALILTVEAIRQAYHNRPTAPASCRDCGCTDDRACWPTCWWVEPDLCSSCRYQRQPTSPTTPRRIA